jgi:2-methylisocitrate lyase-like PEP mutase family enzyme
VNGWEDVIARTHAFADAGADLVFVDGIRTRDDLTTYANELVKAGLPCLYNGAFDPTEIERLGFKVQILAGLALGAVHNATTAAMNAWREVQSPQPGRFDGRSRPTSAHARQPPETTASDQPMPVVYDGFTALVAEHAGFSACAVSLDGVAAQLGSDPALVDIADAAAQVRYIVDAVSIPVFAEAPPGLVDAPRVAHCVAQFEAAGAAGVYLDVSDPAQHAALDARTSKGFAIVAKSKMHFAVDALAESIGAVRDALARTRNAETPNARDRLKFDEITSLLKLDDVYALEARYATAATKGP